MRTPDQIAKINEALELCPVEWGPKVYFPDNWSRPLVCLPETVTPTGCIQLEQFACENPHGEYPPMLMCLDAEGKVIVAWMRALQAFGRSVVTPWDETCIETAYDDDMWGYMPVRSTNAGDWLLTLAEAIVEVME